LIKPGEPGLPGKFLRTKKEKICFRPSRLARLERRTRKFLDSIFRSHKYEFIFRASQAFKAKM
jgi:hypothetical protein